MFEGKRVLITGGTGTFGNAVLRRFLRMGVGEVRLFSRDEKKQADIRLSLNDPRVRFFLGDVRDFGSVDRAMSGVDLVFHAAALKQVPSCEFFPLEAIRTNALGAENVMNAARGHGVEKVIVLSTDKAVYPVNVMGLTKALMEKLMRANARTYPDGPTAFSGTRYGNVMASRGSVIPLFVRQIRAGEPLTVTDPGMTRFMMSIDDAVDLVLHAYAHAHTGDIFVRQAPAATIETLALALLKIFRAKNPLRVIGTRHGEKRFETMVTGEELSRAERQGDYFRIPADHRDLDYDAFLTEGRPGLSGREDYHSDNADRLDVDGMAEVLLRLPYVREELASLHSGTA